MHELDNESILLTRLREKRPEHAPLQNVVERGCHEAVGIAGDSFCIRDRLSGYHLFAATDELELDVLFDETEPNLDTFLLQDSRLIGTALLRYPKAAAAEYHLYVLHREDPLPEAVVRAEDDIVPLDAGWLPFMLERYLDPEFGHEPYLADRIRRGPGLGLLHRGERAAFVLQHKNGEVGPLVVDQQFRGHGIGQELMKRFNRELLQRNTCAYGLVKPENLASAGMMTASGYHWTGHSIWWVCRMRNDVLYLP